MLSSRWSSDQTTVLPEIAGWCCQPTPVKIGNGLPGIREGVGVGVGEGVGVGVPGYAPSAAATCQSRMFFSRLQSATDHVSTLTSKPSLASRPACRRHQGLARVSAVSSP